jgi:hypothetical protein
MFSGDNLHNKKPALGGFYKSLLNESGCLPLWPSRDQQQKASL